MQPETITTQRVAEVRRALADARNELQAHEYTLPFLAAATEHSAISALGGDTYGNNELDRKRFLTLALGASERYRAAADAFHACHVKIRTIETELKILEDAIRSRRLRVLEQLADSGGAVPDEL